MISTCDLSGLPDVYDHKPLTTNLVRAINSAVTLKLLASDITEIAYPSRVR